jgi:hypothetical protein
MPDIAAVIHSFLPLRARYAPMLCAGTSGTSDGRSALAQAKRGRAHGLASVSRPLTLMAMLPLPSWLQP